MYVPITSEITIETGMTLREISTERAFTVDERLKRSAEVSGEDVWRISPSEERVPGGAPLLLTRQELSERYFAEVES